ncbi:MAG: metallophosphoesterase [Synergistaceae bacterium]|nr:metallophosphoesterase [Synergistaceae bacterium]MDD3673089.1 metallophosphoesterase [Synergistaceae bacterium]
MRLIITGDTHGDPVKRFRTVMDSIKVSEDTEYTFTKNDLMAVVGDFGVIWGPDTPKQRRIENRILDELEAMPFTTVFIDGNHENFDRLLAFPEEERFGGKVGVLRPSVLHLKQRGHVYDFGGMKTWCFGGGISIDKILRREGNSWWAEEEPSKEEYEYGISQLAANGWRVDIVLTHAAPTRALNALNLKPLLARDLGYEPNLYDPLSPYFDKIAGRLDFDSWVFGHYHKDDPELRSIEDFISAPDGHKSYSALYSMALGYEIFDETVFVENDLNIA